MIKKIYEYAFSEKHSLQRRQFTVTLVICCASLLAVLVSALITQQGMLFSAGLAAALLLFCLVGRYTLKTERFKLGGSIIILISVIFILPVGFFLGGGIYSGAPLWIVLFYVVVEVLFSGKLAVFYLVLTSISSAATVFMSRAHPELVVPLDESYSIFTDIYLAILCVSLLCVALFKFQSIILKHELETTKEQSKKIESLNDVQSNFFTSMSHEIRTPINSIIGLNEMTLREKNLSDEVRENSVNIQNASKMLLSLINDLLDVSKIQSGNMEIVAARYDTSQMLSELTNLHWNRAMEKGLQFEIQVSDNFPAFLYGDVNRVKRVIINLLTNAIKYTDTGVVTLRLGGRFNGPGQFLLGVEVEDTGMGIKKESIPYLFDTFRRVNVNESKNIEGTGLGLSISKQLVDLMGGTITVDSIYTKGSTFRVEIPQEVVGAETMSLDSSRGSSGDHKEYHQAFEAPEAMVLIVDDNELNRMVCRKLLRETQVQVDLADSGKKCLELVRQKHYDAIFMDHEMPELDGIETFHELTQMPDSLCRDTPVIALTANAGSDREEFYLKAGFSAYLAKPIQSKQLESLLLACLPDELVEKKYMKTESETGFAEAQFLNAVRKKPFIVTTDSICDLPEDILHKNDIKIMYYYIKTNKGHFRDLKEIDSDNLYQFVRTPGNTAQSLPASVKEYEEFFGEALSEARFVLHISSSRNVSGAYQNAVSAAKSFGSIHVVDSGLISTALGMVALKASQLLRDGVLLEDTLQELERYQDRIRLEFMVPTLPSASSRYKSAKVLRGFANAFNAEPVFTIKRSKLRIHRLLLGYVRSTLDQFIRSSLHNTKHIDTKRLFVVFCGCSPEKRRHVLREIERYVSFDEIIVQKASASMFSNCGPDTVGLVFETK